MLCAVACRGGMPPPAPGTVVVALESAPAVLDPRYTTDANSSLVADLVTRGLTNRQIANRLVITPRAAAAHVEHILDKLGAGSRTQIGVWVAQRGLLTTRSA